jgi:hypothetical protein
MAKKATSTKKAARTTRQASAEPQGDHKHLATPEEEDKAREAATKPAAVKQALSEGKKDPIAKFGDPDADPVEIAVRRANFG